MTRRRTKKPAQLDREIASALSHVRRGDSWLPRKVIRQLENTKLPKGWRATWEYPGYVLFSHGAGTHEIVVGEDGGDALVQITTAEGHHINDGEVFPLSKNHKWSAGEIIEMATPWIDKYHP